MGFPGEQIRMLMRRDARYNNLQVECARSADPLAPRGSIGCLRAASAASVGDSRRYLGRGIAADEGGAGREGPKT